jgi:hypothetical protein
MKTGPGATCSDGCRHYYRWFAPSLTLPARCHLFSEQNIEGARHSETLLRYSTFLLDILLFTVSSM